MEPVAKSSRGVPGVFAHGRHDVAARSPFVYSSAIMTSST
jgi:hypothetical protein